MDDEVTDALFDFLRQNGIETSRESIAEVVEDVLVHREARGCFEDGLITLDELVTLVLQHVHSRIVRRALDWDDRELHARLRRALSDDPRRR
ncbi:hypothetical protein [Sandaracinus amylolyticus]|uniref:hypothetical protein n=1 Tax=Sandaracinus amylolyticus TaxID=927083 RepID=UPI001F1A1378|nr:hypothetical protein [Sandaracinus amylolyticus]UJR79638.1 Hypothetical protein I5071_16760 [Sandaracinus amylolyticus]